MGAWSMEHGAWSMMHDVCWTCKATLARGEMQRGAREPGSQGYVGDRPLTCVKSRMTIAALVCLSSRHRTAYLRPGLA